MNARNKLAHGLVLAFFAMASWLVWALLQLPAMVRLHGAQLNLPAFTLFCVNVGPVVIIGLVILATAYCLWVWRKKSPSSWVAFLATGTSALFLVALPIVIAIYLPLVAALQTLAAK